MNHRGPATLRAVRFAALAAMSLYSPVHAQPCWEVSWQPGQGVPGVSGVVHAAALWDPDGSGPRSPVVVFGGDFALAGDQPARNLATWDPATGRWSQLMGGTDGPVRAILVRGSGQLVIAGDFTSAGGVAASRIAQQDGLILRPLGAGVDAPVHALLEHSGGALIASGEFRSAGGAPAEGIAKFDAAQWSPLGQGLRSGLPTTRVMALAELPGGHLIAAGRFELAGAVQARTVARWDGSQWSNMQWFGGGDGTSLAVLPSGELVMGGTFRRGSGWAAVRWSGETWVDVGGTLNGPIHHLSTLPDGRLLLGGEFSFAAGFPVGGVATWSPAGWQAFDSGVRGHWITPPQVRASVQLPGGDLLIAGSFFGAGDSAATNTALWRTDHWERLASGFNRPVYCLASDPAGTFYAGGEFTAAGGVPANFVAARAASAWTPLGSGLASLNPAQIWAAAIAPFADGVFVGGEFSRAGGTVSPNLARWSSGQWAAVSSALPSVNDISPTRGGGVLISAGGDVFQAQPGSSSIPSLDLNASGSVLCAAELDSGEILAGGSFARVNSVTFNSLAIRGPSGWQPLAGGVTLSGLAGSVAAIIQHPSGDVFVAGSFDRAGGVNGVPAQNIARWDGTAWHPLDLGLHGRATALAILPSGDLLVAGCFSLAGGRPAPGLARWNGFDWSAPSQGPSGNSACVYAVHVLPSGDVAVAGDFLLVGGRPSAFFAAFTSDSPCCDPDYDRDGNVDQVDVAVLWGDIISGPNPTGRDPDFNHDGNADQDDLAALINVIAGGVCP